MQQTWAQALAVARIEDTGQQRLAKVVPKMLLPLKFKI